MNLLKPEIRIEMREKRKQSIMRVLACQKDYSKHSSNSFRSKLNSDMDSDRKSTSNTECLMTNRSLDNNESIDIPAIPTVTHQEKAFLSDS